MADRPGSSAMTIALAAPGDGPVAVALGALAVEGLMPVPGTAPSALARAIDTHGGLVPLPYGHGRCLIARAGDTVAGMAYTTPPIRWIEELSSPNSGRRHYANRRSPRRPIPVFA